MSSTANRTGQDNEVAGVIEKIERAREARRHKFYLRDEHITLNHGGGGKATRNLIEGVFAPAFANPLLEPLDDSATFTPGFYHRFLRT